ncbi:MAG: hypothetical protein IPL46_28640 [Saprospiraceae bacterium]|nr:hypothetical protein [Saprospiraceae bacterium]
MIFVRALLLIGVSSLVIFQTFGQSLPVRWLVDEPPPVNLPDSLMPVGLTDSCLVYLKQMHQSAYLEASIDSIWQFDKQIWIKLHLGPTYRWSYLDFSEIPTFIQNDLDISVSLIDYSAMTRSRIYLRKFSGKLKTKVIHLLRCVLTAWL